MVPFIPSGRQAFSVVLLRRPASPRTQASLSPRSIRVRRSGWSPLDHVRFMRRPDISSSGGKGRCWRKRSMKQLSKCAGIPYRSRTEWDSIQSRTRGSFQYQTPARSCSSPAPSVSRSSCGSTEPAGKSGRLGRRVSSIACRCHPMPRASSTIRPNPATEPSICGASILPVASLPG